MDPKYRKFKQQESKSHEKLLKVILQIYKPFLRKNNKKPPEEEEKPEDWTDDELETVQDPQKTNYSLCKVKVDDETLEKQRREEQGRKLLGSDYPHLLVMYVNNEISMAQLKQHYYSLSKKIEYTCYDNLKSSLHLSEPGSSQASRVHACLKYSTKPEVPRPRTTRPKSASWNYNTKVAYQGQISSMPGPVQNREALSKPSTVSGGHRRWNSSVKASVSLISEPCRMVNVTNDRKERPVKFI